MIAIAPLLGYPEYYATSDGNIIRRSTGIALAQRVLHNGYKTTTLRANGKAQPKLVHILILTAFKGCPPINQEQLSTCDHVDRNRQNNCIENLRWATPSQQAANSAGRRGEHSSKYRAVVTINCETGEEIIYPRLADAMAALVPYLHPCSSTVYNALKSGSIAYCHLWKYADPPAGVFKAIPASFIHGSNGYLVSDTGYVMTPDGRTTRGTLGKSREYYSVNINRHEYRVHRLVAATFLPMHTSLTLVNHKNGRKLDNKVTNLEWIDAKGNAQHAVKTGLSSTPPGRKVDQVSTDGQFIQCFDSLQAAARAVGDHKRYRNILACCAGRQKSAYGFIWHYTSRKIKQ